MEKIASKSEESRLSHIEKKLQAQEEKFSALQTKQEFQFNKITDGLNALKSSLFDSKSQNKRAANETSKNSRKVCTDSSRLCTFFYPDHPDVKAAVKSNGNTSSYKTVQNVLNSDVKTIHGQPHEFQWFETTRKHSKQLLFSEKYLKETQQNTNHLLQFWRIDW